LGIATTRSKLRVASKRLADPALDPVPDDGVPDLLGDGDADATLASTGGQKLEDEPLAMDAVTLALDAQELAPSEDPTALGKGFVPAFARIAQAGLKQPGRTIGNRGR